MPVTRLLKYAGLGVFILLIGACKPAAEAPQTTGAAPAPATATVSEDQRLAAFFEEVFDRNISQNPEFQAILGIRTADYGRWNDYSDEFAQLEDRQSAADLKRLHAEFDYDALGDDARLSYRIFEYMRERDLANFKWRFHDYAISQMDDVSSDLPTFLKNVHRVDTRADAEAYISRLEGVETVMQQVIEQLRQGEAIGVIPPLMIYPRVLPGAQNMLRGAPFEEAADDGVLLADFRAKLEPLELDAEDKATLLNDAANALSGPFRNGYQALIEELLRLQSLADTNDGAWSLPDGEAYYTNRISNWTTVDRTPEELHQLGLAEVARIRAEMQQVMDEIGFDGDLAAFFEYVRTNPENYFPDTNEGRQAYLAEAAALIDGIYDIAPDYFNVLPQAALEVRRVEPWREKGSSTAFYNRPAPDGSRPGIVYINMQDMSQVQKHIMNSLAYHEGAPGHHFQVAIQQELQGLPKFRLYGRFSAYSEGWALYAERLVFEAGLYEGMPMRNFGRLAEEMKRAVRLVIDTGAHYKRWPLEQSIAYMTDNTPMAPADIERQVMRYYVLPGQALSYKVGMLTILDLRERAREQLGEDYDIREFHDAVLKNGAVPMQVLEGIIEDYIQDKKAESA
jgi:uncharacterized protein (DUF885 family)